MDIAGNALDIGFHLAADTPASAYGEVCTHALVRSDECTVQDFINLITSGIPPPIIGLGVCNIGGRCATLVWGVQGLFWRRSAERGGAQPVGCPAQCWPLLLLP